MNWEDICMASPSSVTFFFWLLFVAAPHGGQGAGIACWLECRTRDRKVASSNPCRSGGRIFFSRVNFVCLLLLHVRSTPLFTQWHVKEPGHSAKNAGGRSHLNTHTPSTPRSRSGLTMPLLESIKKRSHTQLVREHLVTVV